MNQQLATIAYVAGILTIFYFDRDKEVRTSRALWVPVMWLMITGSRPVSQWLQSGPTIGDQYADGSPLDAAVFGVLLIAGLVALGKRWRQVEGFARSNPIILLFIFYCLISTLWSDYSFVAFKRWIKSLGDIVMILIVLTEPDQRGAIRRFLCRVGYVLIPVSILFIKYYPDLGRSYNPWTWIPMYCGVTTFKNQLGMITLVCALGVLWCFIRTWRNRSSSRWKHLLAQCTILSMSIWIFLIADSMTSFACFILSGFVMVIANQTWIAKRPVFVHLMVAGVITLSVIALFFNSSGNLVQTLGRNSSLTGRTDIWKIVLELSQRRPLLGTGFESFWMGDRLQTVWQFERGIQEAHNGYLEVYANLGWIGIVLLAGLIVTGYWNVYTAYSRDRVLGSIKLAFFTMGVIYSLTEAGFRMMSPAWLGFLLAIIHVPPRGLEKKSVPLRVKATVKDHEPYPVLTALHMADL
jgi:exopolysaccharide production protein ExoQ